MPKTPFHPTALPRNSTVIHRVIWSFNTEFSFAWAMRNTSTLLEPKMVNSFNWKRDESDISLKIMYLYRTLMLLGIHSAHCCCFRFIWIKNRKKRIHAKESIGRLGDAEEMCSLFGSFVLQSHCSLMFTKQNEIGQQVEARSHTLHSHFTLTAVQPIRIHCHNRSLCVSVSVSLACA